MLGLELSEAFYWQVIAPLIERHFPRLKDRHAAGLIGYGSDVLGFDDEWSRDHEWGPRDYIFLTDADYRYYARRLGEIFNAELPRQFMGFQTRFTLSPHMPVLVPAAEGQPGMHHIAITSVRRFLRIQLGIRRMPLEFLDWLCVPEQKLLELTRGKVFFDSLGEISRTRQAFAYLPEDIWRYKLCYAWQVVDNLDVVMLNAVRGDNLSAHTNLNKLVDGIIRLVFLYNRRYCPGTPKWVSREFYTLPFLANEIGPRLEICQVLSNVKDCGPILTEVLCRLVDEHNRMKITAEVVAGAPEFRSSLFSFSALNIVKALQDSLPNELRQLEIQGTVDQWVTNEDVLIWSELYTRLKSIYKMQNKKDRSGPGDRMI